MIFRVYVVRNIKNEKFYIGITKKPLSLRLHEHIIGATRYKRSGRFADAIRKHGSENFQISSIATSESWKEINLSEIFFIALFKAQNPLIGYNIHRGGRYTHDHTPETRKCIGEKARARGPLTDAHKRKISFRSSGSKNGMFGKEQSDAGKERIRESNKRRAGEKRSDVSRLKMSDAAKIRVRSPEHVEALRLAVIASNKRRAKSVTTP